MRSLALLLGLLFVAASAAAQTVTFPGTISSVNTINTQNLLSVMNGGSSNFVAVAAHRGYWQNVPENSIQAIQAAYNGGVEAVEIDVRLASNFTSPPFQPYAAANTYGILADTNAGLVLSHDECVDRITNGSGALRFNANTKCLTGAGFSQAGFQALSLRNRTGAVMSYGPPSFANALNILKSYLSIDSNGTLRGPVLVIDLKDKENTAPANNSCTECVAWNEYVYGLSVMRSVLTDSRMWPAVVWKLKMASALPSATTVANEVSGHPAYGHLVLTINPEDVSNTATVEQDDTEYQDGSTDEGGYGPNGSSFQLLLGYSYQSPPYVAQFEYVPFNPNDGSSLYLTQNVANTTPPLPLADFATYYQPSFYPEGVATRFGGCCYLAPINQAENNAAGGTSQSTVDTRGILDFATFYTNFTNSVTNPTRTTTITSDNLLETMNYLVATGYRKLSAIQ